MPIQQIGFQGRPPVFTWATKPAANAVPVGYTITIPEFSHSDWYSDGTYWRPVGGYAVLRNLSFANVSHAYATITQVAGIPAFFMPADLVATPGLHIGNSLNFHRETAAPAVGQNGSVRIGSDVNFREFGNLTISGTTANQVWRINERRLVNSGRSGFSRVSSTTGLQVNPDTWDTTALSTISGANIIVSALGVDTGGGDTLWFDSWLIEAWA